MSDIIQVHKSNHTYCIVGMFGKHSFGDSFKPKIFGDLNFSDNLPSCGSGLEASLLHVQAHMCSY